MVGIFALALVFSQIQWSFQSANVTVLKEYDKLVCGNEPTCSWLTEENIEKFPKDRTTLKKRNCMCDSSCTIYRDCCFDSQFFDVKSQQQPQTFYCSPDHQVYMKTSCPATYPHENVSDRCRKSTLPVDSDDVSVVTPVTNPSTGVTYGNVYCAICHNDRNFQSWRPEPRCGESPFHDDVETSSRPPPNRGGGEPSEPALARATALASRGGKPFAVGAKHQKLRLATWPSSDANSEIVLHIHVYGRPTVLPVLVNGAKPAPSTLSDAAVAGWFRRRRASLLDVDLNKYAREAPAIWENAKYDPVAEQFRSEYEGKRFVCDFTAKIPDELGGLPRRCVPDLVDTCPEGSNSAWQHYCQLHTAIVYDKSSKTAYRNKFCAACNGESESDIAVCLPVARSGV